MTPKVPRTIRFDADVDRRAHEQAGPRGFSQLVNDALRRELEPTTVRAAEPEERPPQPSREALMGAIERAVWEANEQWRRDTLEWRIVQARAKAAGVTDAAFVRAAVAEYEPTEET